LNRYFPEMSEAVESAGGYVDKFIGDGVMALFGLDVSVAQASSQALTAVGLMSTRLDELNRALADDLDGRLRIGIGVHAGPAIVGEMGYGRIRSLTAIGDTVNIASRLQSLCKNHACELLVSEELLLRGGLGLADAPRHEIEIRGRRSHIAIRTVTRISDLRVTTLAAPIVSTRAETVDETDNGAPAGGRASSMRWIGDRTIVSDPFEEEPRVASKLNADGRFLARLRDAGRRHAQKGCT
jgi:class 3 adenylate cyclase